MTIGEKFGVSALLLVLAIVLAAFMTNAGRNMTVDRFDLLDARHGERVMLDYNRTIKREFDATWRLDLYRDGVWVAVATSPGVHPYRTTAVLPPAADLDLDWLSYGDPAFHDLACGEYEAVVRWTINPGSFAMKRILEARDHFTVFCHAN